MFIREVTSFYSHSPLAYIEIGMGLQGLSGAWWNRSSRMGLCPMISSVTSRNKVRHTVYPNKYAHGFVVLCFVVVMQSFIMNSREVFIHIHQGCIAGTAAIVRLPQCQWSKPDGYGKISQCITTTKHNKAKTVCIFLGIYYIIFPSPVTITTYHIIYYQVGHLMFSI